jgi:uncharacterized protein (DUF433 family)
MEIRHHQFARITMNQRSPSAIRGIRMPVASILRYLSGRRSIEEALKQWPELRRENIYQALGFAATLIEVHLATKKHQ